jgi:quinol-cytochrome oxidoreductase complex cytochrome b subunit
MPKRFFLSYTDFQTFNDSFGEIQLFLFILLMVALIMQFIILVLYRKRAKSVLSTHRLIFRCLVVIYVFFILLLHICELSAAGQQHPWNADVAIVTLYYRTIGLGTLLYELIALCCFYLLSCFLLNFFAKKDFLIEPH